MASLKGKVVFITGASFGIGLACAEKFAEEGSRLILTARREDKLLEIAETITEKYNVDVLVRKLDVTDKKQVVEVIGNLPKEWEKIDILLNNAGLALGVEKIFDADVNDWEIMLDTNVKGLLYVSREIIPGMISRGTGHIINLGSIAGHQVYQGGSVYCASKHAVNALTQAMQVELVATPLRATAISPGMVETEFSIVRYKGDKQQAGKMYKGIDPLVAEDISEAVIFAASRPPHVNINEMIIMPTNQANSYVVYKNKRQS